MEHNMVFNFEHTYQSLPTAFYKKVMPSAALTPSLVLFNHALAHELGVDVSKCSNEQLVELFSGKRIFENASPIAQAYAGHQFGGFTNLGDGRAVLLGEHRTPDEHIVDVQLKGAGTTPYSRNGDGKATVSAMLREYIISEAMHFLGIATSRSLAVCTSGDTVWREEGYPGALLTRIASSHIRVGTFEYAAHVQGKEALQALLTYTINRHYPELSKADTPALALLKKVMDKQINLICDWMRVGFIHGVMNTDNMSIAGETIDYGPCAFMLSLIHI